MKNFKKSANRAQTGQRSSAALLRLRADDLLRTPMMDARYNSAASGNSALALESDSSQLRLSLVALLSIASCSFRKLLRLGFPLCFSFWVWGFCALLREVGLLVFGLDVCFCSAVGLCSMTAIPCSSMMLSSSSLDVSWQTNGFSAIF